jgi:hypothetical protein
MRKPTASPRYDQKKTESSGNFTEFSGATPDLKALVITSREIGFVFLQATGNPYPRVAEHAGSYRYILNATSACRRSPDQIDFVSVTSSPLTEEWRDSCGR